MSIVLVLVMSGSISQAAMTADSSRSSTVITAQDFDGEKATGIFLAASLCTLIQLFIEECIHDIYLLAVKGDILKPLH